MQIFVSGTWSDAKAVPFADDGRLLGRLIANGGYDLACGPGTGIAKYVVEGYRSIESRGVVRFYLPLRSEMEKVGEIIGDGADELIETGFDYPMRNIYQIRASDALFILTGGDGTLEEAITALSDYLLPVAAVRGSGTAAQALEALVSIYPAWEKLLRIGESVQELCTYLFGQPRLTR
jgi:predicted Rossmann-fold nucleotide-binding protein